MRLTCFWRKLNWRSESPRRLGWLHRKNCHFSPLLCSTIENDTNEGPNSYLSPKMCPLCNFFISKSLDTRLGPSYFVLFHSFLQTRRVEECIWNTFLKFPASQKLEICPSKFFVPFFCLRPWLIKRINELGLSFSCSLNHEKSFIEHRVIPFQIRWTN